MMRKQFSASERGVVVRGKIWGSPDGSITFRLGEGPKSKTIPLNNERVFLAKLGQIPETAYGERIVCHVAKAISDHLLLESKVRAEHIEFIDLTAVPIGMALLEIVIMHGVKSTDRTRIKDLIIASVGSVQKEHPRITIEWEISP